MKISVVMAVRDGERYVHEAIQSVLAQTISDYEFFIVDDASTDSTPDILSDYERQDSRIRVLRNTSNLGPYPSVNRALACATGDFVARHDADDISPPERFAIQLNALTSDSCVSLVTGAIEVFRGASPEVTGIMRPPSWQPELEWELLFRNAVGAGAHVMFPRLLKGSPIVFPARDRYAEDYGLWCRLSRLGKVVCPGDVIYRYRVHGASISARYRGDQDACRLLIARDNQSRYLTSTANTQTLDELSRFWLADGRRQLLVDVRTLDSLIGDLSRNFLTYVERRYGVAAGTRLWGHVNDQIHRRWSYWLFRSVRFADWMNCAHLFSVAFRRRETWSVCFAACKLAARAGIGRTRHWLSPSR